MRSVRSRRPFPRAAAVATGDEHVDAELVARANAGDRAAEEEIYRRHVGYVGGMVLRLLVDQAEAEDALQDTFVLAFEQLSRLRAGTSLRPWLAQIAVTQVHRRFRRKRLLRLVGLDRSEDRAALEAIAAPGLDPEVRAELAALVCTLATLPPDPRIAWCLRYVEGATLDEVAAACRCSLATAKRRIGVAAAHIRAAHGVEPSVVSLPVADARAELNR
jgi:RNA polymerase sigma-70 factor (ECF subfamily)